MESWCFVGLKEEILLFLFIGMTGLALEKLLCFAAPRSTASDDGLQRISTPTVLFVTSMDWSGYINGTVLNKSAVRLDPMKITHVHWVWTLDVTFGFWSLENFQCTKISFFAVDIVAGSNPVNCMTFRSHNSCPFLKRNFTGRTFFVIKREQMLTFPWWVVLVVACRSSDFSTNVEVVCNDLAVHRVKQFHRFTSLVNFVNNAIAILLFI